VRQPVEPGTAYAALEFGRVRVLSRQRQLLADGVPVELGTRAFDLLLVLLEADGLLVSKGELPRRVWPGFVVSEETARPRRCRRVRRFPSRPSGCISPSQTVSQQIKRLEREAARPLFRRSTRAVALTNAGEMLLGDSSVVKDKGPHLDALARQHIGGGGRILKGRMCGKARRAVLRRIVAFD
jgi:hypothetical protein